MTLRPRPRLAAHPGRLLLGLACLILGSAFGAPDQTAPPTGPARNFSLLTYRVKDGAAQIALGVNDGILMHAAVTSSLSSPPEVRTMIGYEFAIRIKGRDLTPFDFKFVAANQDGPGSLDLELQALDLPLDLALHYRAAPGAHYINKTLELKPRPGAAFFVKEIVLWAFEPWDETIDFDGPGQPVHVGDAFFGVAYPSADNEVIDGNVKCSYLVGLEIGEAGYVSRTAVYGVARPGAVHDAFLDYIDRVRARPVAPFLLYNTWYDLRDFSDQDVIASVDGLKQNLTDPYGIRLDAVVLDDGYDDFNQLWRPDPRRFPDGFAPVVAKAAEVGAHLGLWMSPVGGYATNHARRMLGSIGHRFEKSAQGFCIAGRRHGAYFAETMAGYVRASGVNYFKLDNLTRACKDPTHGHRVGRYEQVGLTDAFIDVMAQAREADPAIMINITVGSWLSPWWLLHADVAWRGGGDFGFTGAGTRRQQTITYVDAVLDRRLRQERAQFPINSLMTHGVIRGTKGPDLDDSSLRDFADDVWLYFTRGVMMQELYLSPGVLDPAEWRTLADAIAFSRDQAWALDRAEMVLGDPGADEVYGFLHPGDGHALLTLRNPADQTAAFPDQVWVELPASLRPDPTGACRVRYSSTDSTLADPLAPFEVRVILCSDRP